jgi:acyl-CoA synthetase (AMP-forming)/AMP-acid ligase II
VNAADLLIDAVAAQPADTAATATAIHWVDRDRALTYREAVDAMARAAAVLAGFGVPPGGRVGLFAHPGLDYVVALLGAWRLGAIAVLVDLADKDRFHELMTAAAPHAVVYTNDHFDYVRPTPAALGASGPGAARPSSGPDSHSRPTVFAGMDGPQSGTVGWLDALSEATPLAEPPSPSPTANATAANAIALTAPASATTRTHAELIEAAATVAARLDLNPDDATLCPTPLAQPFHLEASILPALLRGATAGLLKSWQPDDAWEAMERNGTTVLCGTPEHCVQLLEASAIRGRKPASLRAAVTTATTPHTDDLADRLRTELDVDLLVTPSPSH